MSSLRLSPVWAFGLVILCQFVITSAGDAVPVLLWGGEKHNFQSAVNPLEKTSAAEFERILTRKIGKSPWPVLVFLRDNLCVEDLMQHKEGLSRLANIGSLEYFPAVESSLAVFKALPSYNLTVEDDVEIVMENQLALTSAADLNAVVETYNMVRNSSPNLIAALTGKTCTYSRSERVRRQAEDNSTVVAFQEGRFLLYTSDGFLLQTSSSDGYKQLGVPSTVTSNGNGSKLSPLLLVMKFKEPVTLRFRIYEKFIGYWTLENIEYEQSNNKMILTARPEIVFPFNFSYHCSLSNVYHNGDVSLKLSNIQIQIDAQNSKFNDGYDCVGFTTIPIWTGLFVTVLIAIIVMWGLIMIMDIRTMDRFDDPKGKSITIFAQD